MTILDLLWNRGCRGLYHRTGRNTLSPGSGEMVSKQSENRHCCTLMKRILRLLCRAYGPRRWKCWGRGVDVLVETILSQNTSDTNSSAGFKQLRRRFHSWNKVADADVEEIERHIRVAGLSKQKAPRIRQILRQIRSERGKIDLQFLHELGEQEAYDYLTGFKGVGKKTANCVLLFA